MSFIDDYYASLKQKPTLKKVRINEVGGVNNSDSLVLRKQKKNNSSISLENIDSKTIIINSVYDNFDRLVELCINEMRYIPRILMQIIAYSSSFCPKLTKITIKRCSIDVYTIYEIKKLLPSSMITEVCLDYSPLVQANYATLLDEASNLKHLSLVGCHIDDVVCKLIMTKLVYNCPAETNLLLLNLSCNHITDVGAQYIGETLRTNRHLRYLNLSGNRITDEGATYIFNSLCNFVVTQDELYEKKNRFMKTLKSMQARHALEILHNIDDQIISNRKGTRVFKKSSTASLRRKSITSKFDFRVPVGEKPVSPISIDPFSSQYVVLKKGKMHCTGNMVLCYLNLSYNNMSYLSLTKLKSVLLYQILAKKLDQTGLIKVVVDGNNMPEFCEQMQCISELLTRCVVAKARAFADLGARRKSVGRTPR